MNYALPPFLAHFPDALQHFFHLDERHEIKKIEQACIQALNKNETLTLSRPQHAQIECFNGCVWVTQDGDPRDILLEAGQTLEVDQPARVLVHALESSQVRLQLIIH